MGELEIATVCRNAFQEAVIGNCIIHCTMYKGNAICLFLNNDSTKVLTFDENQYCHSFTFRSDFSDSSVGVKIVGRERKIIMLDNLGNLYNLHVLSCKTYGNKSFCWSKFEDSNFTKVLAITDTHQESLFCLGLNKNGKKQLKIFQGNDLKESQEYIFNDLNATPSHDYYLKAVEIHPDVVSLIISDRFSGRTYLCQGSGKSSVIYYSRLKLIFATIIKEKNCLLLCFENGKLFIHFFNQSSSDSTLYLNKRIVCIENCVCNVGCFLWSDGALLHHTEINFNEEGIKMRNFKIQNNITGVLAIAKHEDYFVAVTLNKIFYKITVRQSEGKELVQTPSDILSLIYDESLKIKNIQEDIEHFVYYSNCKQMIQSNQLCMELSSEGNFLSIKNMLNITFKKQFWKVEVRMFDGECECVKVIKLDTDIVRGMIFKFPNPFTEVGRVRVSLFGNFEWEIFSICIGAVGKCNELNFKKNLKKKLEQIRLFHNPVVEKKRN